MARDMKIEANASQASTPEEIQALNRFSRGLGKPLMQGLAFLFVIALVVGAYMVYRQRAAQSAFNMLTNAKSIAQLEEMLNRYPSTEAAPLGMLALAKAYYDSGNYERAYGTYMEFQTKYASHTMAPVAELGIAHCMEATYQMDQAVEAYSKFASVNTNHFLVPLSMLGKARCFQQIGRYKEAMEIHEDIIVKYPDKSWRVQAEEALQQIKDKTASGAATK